MTDAPSPEPDAAPKRSGCLRAFVIVALALIVAGTGLAVYFGETAKQLFHKATSGFLTAQTTLKTEELLLEIGRTHGDVLEVASPMKTVETFSKSDVRHAAWGWIYLGSATSEVKVPATFRFHIKLSEIQQARLDGSTLVLTAPAIHPSLPVAFDTTAMEKKTDGTWLRFDTPQQLADLEKNITPALEARAQAHVATIREHARQDIADFVQKWIVDRHSDYRRQVAAVKVIFPGEDARMVDKRTPIP